jgi:hypothetical protein
MKYLGGKKVIITVNKNFKGTYQDFSPTSPSLNEHEPSPTLDLEMRASSTEMNESKMKREW